MGLRTSTNKYSLCVVVYQEDGFASRSADRELYFTFKSSNEIEIKFSRAETVEEVKVKKGKINSSSKNLFLKCQKLENNFFFAIKRRRTFLKKKVRLTENFLEREKLKINKEILFFFILKQR